MLAATARLLMVSGDDAAAAAFVRQCQRERVIALRAGSADQASHMLSARPFDVIVLDLALPDDDGFEALRRLRTVIDVPIMLLTETEGEVDEVVGLTLGADACMPRRAPPRLLVAQVKALLRRARSPEGADRMRLASLELDPKAIRATVDGQDLNLTLSEFRVLQALLRASGAALTRRQLLQAVSDDEPPSQRTIDAYVCRIRRKLTERGLDGWLQTVRSVGYRLVRGHG